MISHKLRLYLHPHQRSTVLLPAWEYFLLEQSLNFPLLSGLAADCSHISIQFLNIHAFLYRIRCSQIALELPAIHCIDIDNCLSSGQSKSSLIDYELECFIRIGFSRANESIAYDLIILLSFPKLLIFTYEFRLYLHFFKCLALTSGIFRGMQSLNLPLDD